MKPKMLFQNGVVIVRPVEFFQDEFLSCRLISPARLMQWISIDSHRSANLKACHEIVGKPECKTCPIE